MSSALVRETNVFSALTETISFLNNIELKKENQVSKLETFSLNSKLYSMNSLVCLCGFGNLRGRIEVWNLSSTNKIPNEITTIEVDDVTSFEWSPDGEHILTATTAPRLRVSNG
jgi:uncharacterized protein with WD repeat